METLSRRRDDRATAGDAATNDVLLQTRESRVAGFHREVATRNHDRVTGIDDGLEIFDRLGPLDFRHNARITAGIPQTLARFVQISRRPHE